MCDAAKTVLRVKFIALKTKVEKKKSLKIENSEFSPKKLGKKQSKTKGRGGKEIIKMKAEINEIENRQTLGEIKKPKVASLKYY